MENIQNSDPPLTPESTFLENRSGLKFYSLKQTLLITYDPKIKLFSIGEEIYQETKTIFLLGATGSGKTSLINGLANHILGVKFCDNYRYVLKDETGDRVKTAAESQTDYVVGYLIYSPPDSGLSNNYLIIDSPGFKDSRGQEKDEEVTQQIRTFLQDVGGVDELSCIGFVVNGTIARIGDQFREIVEEFCEIFGSNAKDVIRVLISFGHMKRPPVIDVLECSCLKDYKYFKFDNVALKAVNHIDDENSEDDIALSRIIWKATARVYDSLLSEVNSVNAVSLGMTREMLDIIEQFDKCIDCLTEETRSYVDLMLAYKFLEGKCKHYQNIKDVNQDWQGTVDVKVREKISEYNWKERLIKHTHICEKCMITCEDSCKHYLEFYNECPKPGEKCKRCPCPNENHVRSTERIRHRMEKRPVIHEDKKALFEDAVSQESHIQHEMKDLSAPMIAKINRIVEFAHEMTEYMNNIIAASLGKELQSAQEWLEQVLEQVKMEKMEQTKDSPERQSHIISILEFLQTYLFSTLTQELFPCTSLISLSSSLSPIVCEDEQKCLVML